MKSPMVAVTLALISAWSPPPPLPPPLRTEGRGPWPRLHRTSTQIANQATKAATHSTGGYSVRSPLQWTEGRPQLQGSLPLGYSRQSTLTLAVEEVPTVTTTFTPITTSPVTMSRRSTAENQRSAAESKRQHLHFISVVVAIFIIIIVIVVVVVIVYRHHHARHHYNYIFYSLHQNHYHNRCCYHNYDHHNQPIYHHDYHQKFCYIHNHRITIVVFVVVIVVFDNDN